MKPPKKGYLFKRIVMDYSSCSVTFFTQPSIQIKERSFRIILYSVQSQLCACVLSCLLVRQSAWFSLQQCGWKLQQCSLELDYSSAKFVVIVIQQVVTVVQFVTIVANYELRTGCYADGTYLEHVVVDVCNWAQAHHNAERKERVNVRELDRTTKLQLHPDREFKRE